MSPCAESGKLSCIHCHTDKDAEWADKLVREWHKRDHQAPVLHWAGLVDAARRRDWRRLCSGCP